MKTRVWTYIGVGEATSVNESEDGGKEDSREEVGEGLVSLRMEMSLPSSLGIPRCLAMTADWLLACVASVLLNV